MADNDDLVVKIRADIRALQAGLRQAAKEADIAGKSMQRQLGDRMTSVEKAMNRGATSCARSLLGIGTAAVAAAGVGGLGMMLARSLDVADSLVKLSDQTGVSTEELQRLGYAAGQVGVSQEALTTGTQKLAGAIGQARGGVKSAVADFAALKVQLSDAEGPRKTEEVLLDVIAALEKIEDPAKRAAAAASVFGDKAGREMALLASQGAGGLEQLRATADRLGIVIGDDLVRSGDNAGDALDRLKTVIMAGLNKAVLQAGPEIEQFVTELMADPKALQETIGGFVKAAEAIVKVGAAAAGAIGFVARFAEGLGAAVAEMVHGSATAFEDDLKRLDARIQLMNQNMKSSAPDSTLYKESAEELRRLVMEYSQLRMLQQSYIDAGKAGAAAPPPPPPKPTPAPDGGGLDWSAPATASTKTSGKTPEEEALERALQAEETERMIEGWQEERAAREAERLTERLKAQQDYADAHEEMWSTLEADTLDRESLAMQQEQDRFTQRLAMLGEFSDEELSVIGGYNAAKEQLIAQHEDEVFKIRQQGLQSGLDMLAYIKDAETRKYLDAGAKALQIGATYSKKLFELNKVAGIANALVSTYTGVAKALELPFPANLAAAATTLATGIAQVQAIRATKYGGGGAAGSVAGAANPNNVTQPGGAAQGGPQIALTLVGGNFSQDQVRGLITSINEALADGAKLRT